MSHLAELKDVIFSIAVNGDEVLDSIEGEYHYGLFGALLKTDQ